MSSGVRYESAFGDSIWWPDHPDGRPIKIGDTVECQDGVTRKVEGIVFTGDMGEPARNICYDPAYGDWIESTMADRLMPKGFKWPRIDGEKVQLNAPLRIKGREGASKFVCFLAFDPDGHPCVMAMKDYDTYECVDWNEVELS